MQLEHAFLYQVLRGHPEAVGFVTALGRISQVLDDLYDGDKPVTRPQLDETFWDLLVGLPANPFYRAHFAYLHPLVTASRRPSRRLGRAASTPPTSRHRSHRPHLVRLWCM